GSGERGGALVYQGPAAAVREAGTLTGQYLAGDKRIGVPSARRPACRWLTIRGARLHNVVDVDARIPLGTLTAVTGVSGSGKSTLVHDVLYRQLAARLTGVHGAKQHLGEPVGAVRALEGWEAVSDVVLVDQAPIGRTPRSNPVTYIKAFDELRALFAAEPLARARGFTASRGWRARCGICSRWVLATCGSASRPPRSRAAKRSASRSRASWRWRAARRGAGASSTSWTSPPPACTWTTCAPCAGCSIGWW